MTFPIVCKFATKEVTSFPLMVAIDEKLEGLIEDLKKIKDLRGQLHVIIGKANEAEKTLTDRNSTHMLRLYGNEPRRIFSMVYDENSTTLSAHTGGKKGGADLGGFCGGNLGK